MGLTPTQRSIIGTFINGRNATDDFLQLANNHGGTVFGWIDSGGILRGTLASGGSSNVVSESVNFTAAVQTTYLVTTGSSNIVVTLPTAVGVGAESITIKKVDSGTGMVTINTALSQTIDGYTVYDIINQYQFVTILSDNSNWQIVGGN